MRRRAVLERVEQEAELAAALPPRRCRAARTPSTACRGDGYAPNRRRSPSRSAPCRRPCASALPGLGRERRGIVVRRRGERMVHGHPALARPRRTRTSGSRPPTAARQPSATSLRSWPTLRRSAPSASLTTLALVGAEEDQVAVLRAGALEDARDRRIAEELQDRRLQAVAALRALVDLDVGEALGAVARDERGVVVDLACATARRRPARAARRRDPSGSCAGPANTLKSQSATRSATSTSSSGTRRSGLSEP